jgi:hypothetical protein
MSGVKINVRPFGLVNYTEAGKDAVKKIRKAMFVVLNAGRKEARQRITADFTVRTGVLRRDARKMQNRVTIKASQVIGRVKPLPRLMNIFEHGATLARGRGILRPRPVIAPGEAAMERIAHKELDQILNEVGK